MNCVTVAFTNLLHFNCDFIFGKSQKSQGAKSGLYWGLTDLGDVMLCKKSLHESCRMGRRIVVMTLMCLLGHCERDGYSAQSLCAHIACAFCQVVDGHNTRACTREGAVIVKQSCWNWIFYREIEELVEPSEWKFDEMVCVCVCVCVCARARACACVLLMFTVLLLPLLDTQMPTIKCVSCIFWIWYLNYSFVVTAYLWPQ